MKICSICKREWDDAFRMCPIDGIPLQEASGSPDAYIGRTLGQCRITEKIFDADLGPIYKAEESTRGVIAIQITPPDRVGSPVLLEAFADAVKLAAKLSHPHVVRIYGMETVPDGSAAVIMELVSGTDLGSYRRQNPDLEFHEVCTLIRMTAEGVLAAHHMSMIHGALHPSRILVTPEQRIKVGGFHRSALREGVDGQSATAANLPYLAPEQVGILPDAAGPDYRTDIYALGVILYELLTGRLPYDATNIQDFTAIHEGAPPLPPNFINPNVPPLLSRVVAKAISRNPVDRQESMDQFIRELDAVRQPVREPEKLPVTPHSEPLPSPGRGSGLFGSPTTRDAKHDSVEDLWPEAGRDKDGTESSRFSWFKTRAGSSKRHGRPADLRTRHDQDDSSYADSSGDLNPQDDSEIRTVVVSSRGRSNAKRSNLWDTITDFPRRRKKGTIDDSRSRRRIWDTTTDFRYGKMDATGTGKLTDRVRFSKLYVIVPICVIILGLVTVALIHFLSSPTTGMVTIDTEPSNAKLLIRPQNPPDAPWDYRGRTPQIITQPLGKYLARVELEGYTPEELPIEVSKTATGPIKIQLTETPPIKVPVTKVEQAVESGGTTPLPKGSDSVNYEQLFSAALSRRMFFPPAENSAWKYLHEWQTIQASNPSPDLGQALTAFCTALEDYENESLKDRKWKETRELLAQVQNYSPDLNCANRLQDRFKNAQKRYMDEFRPQVLAAMEHQNYVTPANECALFYVRSILSCDDADNQAKMWDRQIFDLAWAQAQKFGKQRRHQDALLVYNELNNKYPNPPLGRESILQAIQKENQRLILFNELNKTVSIAVRHKHSRSFFRPWKKNECTGTLEVSGFEIEYKTVEEDDRFKINYDELTSAIMRAKDRIEIQGNGIQGGKIELEQVRQTSAPNISEICDRINHNRQLYAQYKRME